MSEETREIRIVLDASDPQSPIFVEVENVRGESIRSGKWIVRPDGLREIRFIGILDEDGRIVIQPWSPLPCPFCGVVPDAPDSEMAGIACMDPHCQMPNIPMGLEDWNDRPDLMPEKEDIVKVLTRTRQRSDEAAMSYVPRPDAEIMADEILSLRRRP